MKRLYSSIYGSPGISRSNLAKQTHLSKTTVSTLIDELIDREFIYDSGIQPSDSIGRKPNSLRVRQNSYFIAVLHWEENMVYAYLIDIAGSVLLQESRALGKTQTYIDVSFICLYHSIFQKCDPKKVLGICVVVSAMIDAPTTRSIPLL